MYDDPELLFLWVLTLIVNAQEYWKAVFKNLPLDTGIYVYV